jgi:cytochrome P450
VLLAADDLDLVHTHPAFGQPGLRALERLGVHDGPFYDWRRLTMPAHDGPTHERLRATVVRAFTPRRVDGLRISLREHATKVLQILAARDAFDVVSDYADDLPLWLVCSFLGLPTSAREEIATFLEGTEAGFTDPLTPEARRTAEDGIVALGAYVERLVAERARSSQEDLVSDLIEAEGAGRLSRAELVALVVNVLGGAIGSSRAAIANSLLVLLRHPEQTAWVRASIDERLAPAIEECLRYHPPFRSGRKLVRDDNDVFDVQLSAGDTVFLARQAANRDPQRWIEPDRFDVSRRPERHYSFGYGPHFCLGQALARLDVQEAVRAFLVELPEARLVTSEPRRVPFTADEQLEELVVAPG